MILNGHYDNINDRDYFELEPNLSRLTSIIQLHRAPRGRSGPVGADRYKVRLHKLGELLGFDENTELTDAWNESPNIVNITNTDNIIVNCDLCDTSYRNGKRCSELYSIPITVPPGYSIVSHPSVPLFNKVYKNTVSRINVWLTDSKGNPLNMRNEQVDITLRLQNI